VVVVTAAAGTVSGRCGYLGGQLGRHGSG